MFHGQIDFGGAETAYYSSETKANIAVSLVGTARYRGYRRYLRRYRRYLRYYEERR